MYMEEEKSTALLHIHLNKQKLCPELETREREGKKIYCSIHYG